MSARVVHATRDRLRVRVEGRPRQVAEALGALQERAQGVPGIRRVDVDPGRGSALVEFDPERLDAGAIIDLCRAAHDAFVELLVEPVNGLLQLTGSALSFRLRRSLGTVDRRILEATGGAVDLRMLVPIGLGALAVRQLTRSGPALPQIPWYILAYYSFDTFVKLHGVQPVVEGPAT